MKLSEKPKRIILLPTVLTLFDTVGGAPAGTGAATSAGATGGTGQQQSAAKKTTDKPVVIYGKQDTQTANVQTTPGQNQPGQNQEDNATDTSQYANLSPEEREKQYYKLVRGEFKEEFQKHFQKEFNRRFKEVNAMEARLNEIQPIIDLLMPRYGVKNIAELNAKLEEEVLPDLAEQAGMTPEAYKRQLKLVQENKRLKEENKNISLNQRVIDWQNQAAAMRGTPDKPGKYPDFDLKAAAEHQKYGPKFLRLLEAGIEVEAAYLAAFHEELIGRAQVEAAKKTESATLEAIKSGTFRPAEVGAKPSSGVIHKSSVSQLTAEDRREIAERVKRGEKIKF